MTDETTAATPPAVPGIIEKLETEFGSVEKEVEKGASALANLLSSFCTPFAKLYAYWQATDKKTHIYIVVFGAIAALVTWHYGVKTVYGWFPDHVTHAEVASAVGTAPFAKADDVTALKAQIAKQNAVIEAQRLDVADVKEGLTVLMQKLDEQVEAKSQEAQPKTVPRPRRTKPAPAPSLWDQITGSTK